MLKAGNRLSRDKDIKRVMSIGRSTFSPYFRIKYLQNGKPKNRITVVISAKVSKKAVVRNRLKRQIREIFRLNLDKIISGFDLVVTINQSAIGKDYHELEKSVIISLNKAKLLK
jgi:ribonuclease P protein component